MIRYSVIIPVYNVEDYLIGCLDSLMQAARRLTKGVQMEIICIDDGSTDGSGALLDNYRWDKTVCCPSVIHQKNEGLGSARNIGLEQASGEWVVFVDSDDRVVDDYFVYLEKELGKSSDVDFLKFSSKIVSDFKTTEESLSTAPAQIYEVKDVVSARRLYTCFGTCYAWQACFRRKLIGDLRFEPISPSEDVLFTTHLLERVAKFAISSAQLYLYYQRPGSLMHTGSFSLRQVYSWTYAMRKRCDVVCRWKYGVGMRKELFRCMRTTSVGQFGLHMRRVRPEDVDAAWRIYFDETSPMFLSHIDFVPVGTRWVYRSIFSTRSKLCWRICLFWPWLMRARLARSPIASRVKKFVRNRGES